MICFDAGCSLHLPPGTNTLLGSCGDDTIVLPFPDDFILDVCPSATDISMVTFTLRLPDASIELFEAANEVGRPRGKRETGKGMDGWMDGWMDMAWCIGCHRFRCFHVIAWSCALCLTREFSRL